MEKQSILLMGPTASGKTDLAISLCKRFPCDVISVDSALVYREMDIGTAKPDAATLARTPHRLIDFLEPEESYSAGEFVRDAYREMDDIFAAGRIPLLVGGTMMYFRALTEGIAALPSADEAIRRAIDAEAAERPSLASSRRTPAPGVSAGRRLRLAVAWRSNNTVYLTATRGDDGIPCFSYDLAQGPGGTWVAFTQPYPNHHSTISPLHPGIVVQAATWSWPSGRRV